MIPDQYTTEAISIKAETFIHPHRLHYFAAVPMPDGTVLLVPTQGKLKKYGTTTDNDDVYAYLRYHRRPIFLRHHKSTSKHDYESVEILQEKDLPLEIRARVKSDVRTIAVFDRRHLRVDDDFTTPGEPSDAAKYYDAPRASAKV